LFSHLIYLHLITLNIFEDEKEINDTYDLDIDEDKYIVSHIYNDFKITNISEKIKDIDSLSDDEEINKNNVYDTRRTMSTPRLFLQNLSHASTKYDKAKEFKIEIFKNEKRDCCDYNSRCLVM
jgi:hypothetical protein